MKKPTMAELRKLLSDEIKAEQVMLRARRRLKIAGDKLDEAVKLASPKTVNAFYSAESYASWLNNKSVRGRT